MSETLKSPANEAAAGPGEEADLVLLPAPEIDSMTRAEIDVAIATARRYPRDVRRARDRALSLATLDEETAASCFYSLKRRDQDGRLKIIQGESVRLAEIMVSSWGNIRAGARILGQDETGSFVRAVGICHDLETNTLIAIEARRRITTRHGRRFSDDMVATTANAAASIAFRNAVWRVIPRALVRPIYLKARQVAVGDAKTLGDRRRRAVERFQELGIDEARVLRAVDRRSLEDLTLDDLGHLIGLWNAVHDGEATAEEAFPSTSPAPVGGGITGEDLKPGAPATAAAAPVATSGKKSRARPDTGGASGRDEGAL